MMFSTIFFFGENSLFFFKRFASSCEGGLQPFFFTSVKMKMGFGLPKAFRDESEMFTSYTPNGITEAVLLLFPFSAFYRFLVAVSAQS
jgi:hypothetical protein